MLGFGTNNVALFALARRRFNAIQKKNRALLMLPKIAGPFYLHKTLNDSQSKTLNQIETREISRRNVAPILRR